MIDRMMRACDALGVPHGRQAIVVACSGGPDSAAALHLLRHVRPRARLIACYIDHGMRPKESITRDIAAVREQARTAKATVVIRKIAPPSGAGSAESVARARRYAALAEVARSEGGALVVTGHHRDDLIESLFLALARGSGLDGAASMRARRPLRNRISLLRPLLWVAKSDLAQYAQRAALAASTDETNADPRVRRNAIRALVTAMESELPGVRRALARSARLLAADRMLLDAMTRATLQRCRAKDGALATKLLRALPLPLLRRVVRLAVREAAGAEDFHLAHCQAIAKAIKIGRGGMFHAGKRASVVLSAGKLRVRPSPAASVKARTRAGTSITAAPFKIVFPDAGKIATTRTPFGSIRLHWSNGQPRANTGANTIVLRSVSLKPGMAMALRPPRALDKCVPSGRHRPTSLSRFLAKAGVPRDERHGVTLLCWRGRVAAVLGIRVMEPFAAKTGRTLAIQWRPADGRPRPGR